MDWDPIQTHLKQLFEQRKHKEGLKQDALEAATGIPQSTISRTFKHRWRKGPSLLMFLRLLAGLGVTPSEFFRQVEGGASAPSETLQMPELSQLRDRLRRLTRACDAFEGSFLRPGRRLRRRAKRR